jgi:hypothetical protein
VKIASIVSIELFYHHASSLKDRIDHNNNRCCG